MNSRPIIIMGIFMIFLQSLNGQNIDSVPQMDTILVTRDSIIVFQDSVFIPHNDTQLVIRKGTYKVRDNPYKNAHNFYDSLYYKSRNNKITRELYDLLISYEPPKTDNKKGMPVASEKSFLPYDGKTIKQIKFMHTAILEGSVDDTSRNANSGFARILNKAHIDSRGWVIRKYMLVEPGDQIIPAIIADNERIIRALPGVEDARILVEPDGSNPELVSLIVVIQDIFPLEITGSASSFRNYEAGIRNKNVFGLALELGGQIKYDGRHRNHWGYEANSVYRNIRGTFINNNLQFIDEYGTKRFDAGFSKDFLTPRTRYGGGINFGWIRQNYDVNNSDTAFEDHYESDYQDFWVGRAFLPGGSKSRTNLILSTRYERRGYSRRSFINADSNITFHNKQIFYGKIGISHYNYYKTTMIRSFGNT